jgi:hypothetical protein
VKHNHKHDPPVQACRIAVVNIGENPCLFNADGDPSGQGLIAAGSTAPGLTIPGSSIAKGFRRTFVERCT